MPTVLCLCNPASPTADVIREMAPEGWECQMVGHGTDGWGSGTTGPDDATRQLVGRADFILVYGSRLADDMLRAAKKVRLVQLCSAGYDGVNVALAGELGIPVANNGGANAVPVAEMAVALMLATYRHLVRLDRETRRGAWMPAWGDGRDTHELSGKTVGIVGAGRIGAAVARLLQGFEPVVLYADSVRSESVERLGGSRVDLDTLLARSDLVTLHVPLLPSTRGMIGARELGLMKRSAVLINTSRGKVVDEAALIRALTRHEIWGAGLDVFEEEPAGAENPLFTLDNCVVAPHVAGKSSESFPRRVRFAFDNMQRVWAGEPAESVVAPD
ncbi:MAG: 2-hydroxyacid dehydrogenase [Gemmatimonadetes bacterium]|nr:2-hydroxyacid dehydrogenase [Gemmatimonadota bacterium]